MLVVAGLLVGALAVAFRALADRPVDLVLFSGQDGAARDRGGGLGRRARAARGREGARLVALARLGLPRRPGVPGDRDRRRRRAVAAADLLPGFDTTPAVATGIAAGTAAVLRVPFTAVLLATLLVGSSAPDVAPIAVLAAAVGWIVAVALPNPEDRAAEAAEPGRGAARRSEPRKISRMTWSRRFRIRQNVRGNLWLVPLLGAVLGALLGGLVSTIDEHVDAPSVWTYSPETASNVLTAVVAAIAALTGFVVTVTVLVVQMATGTFSARYMRLWYRDRLLKATLATLIGTLTFSFALLSRTEQDFVPDLGVTIAGWLVAACLLLFVLFFDRFIHRLRPVAVAELVARAGRQAFDDAVRVADRPEIRWEPHVTTADPTFVVRASQPGAIQAVDPDGLVVWAREHDATIVLVRAVGDFVSPGTTLMRVYGGARDLGAAQHELEGLIALGDERTIEQDPAFAIRIMVDIAIRALSPAVNDPTTAVQILNHLEGLLATIGATDFARRAESAEGERIAVVMRARRWDDYLALGVTEIREYGASSIQVMRRLRATLLELHEAVREEHRAAVDDELCRLDAALGERWSDSVDRDRARAADGQGMGGPSAHGESAGP